MDSPLPTHYPLIGNGRGNARIAALVDAQLAHMFFGDNPFKADTLLHEMEYARQGCISGLTAVELTRERLEKEYIQQDLRRKSDDEERAFETKVLNMLYEKYATRANELTGQLKVNAPATWNEDFSQGDATPPAEWTEIPEPNRRAALERLIAEAMQK